MWREFLAMLASLAAGPAAIDTECARAAACVSVARASMEVAAPEPEPVDDPQVVEVEVVEIYTMQQCPPCEALKKDLKADRSVLGGRGIIYRDVSEGRSKGVRAAPTLVLLRGGKEVRRMVGYTGRQSLAKFLEEQP